MVNGFVTGVILAGGQGARLGGCDKGLVPFDGRPLVAHACEALRPQVARVLISANRNAETYSAYGEVVADPPPAFRGPLGGIVAGLRRAETAWLQFVPCDGLGLPAGLVAHLHAGMRCAAAAYARCDGERFYTCCLLPRWALPAAEAALESRARSLRDLLATLSAVPVDIDWPGPARNLNTPDALAAAEAAP